MYSLCVNDLFQFSIEKEALISVRFPYGPRCHGKGKTKDGMEVLIISMYVYIWNTCLHYIDELELLCITLGCDCYILNVIQRNYSSLG